MCLGIPGQVVEIVDLSQHRAVAEVDGVRREVNIGLVMGDVGGIKVGDWVLIHVGFAMTKIDEEEAANTLDFMKQLGSVYDDEIDQFAKEVLINSDVASNGESATSGSATSGSAASGSQL